MMITLSGTLQDIHDYNVEIKTIKNHGNAEALSRINTRPCPLKIALIMVISLRKLNHLLRRNLDYWLRSEREVRTLPIN